MVLQAALTAADLHHEHPASASQEPASEYEHSSLNWTGIFSVTLEQVKTAAGSDLAYSRVLHAGLTAAEMHHEQEASALHESSSVNAHSSFN